MNGIAQAWAEQMENETLRLQLETRAELAETLEGGNEALSAQDIERLWVEEAARRNAELDSGTATMRGAEEVFRDARALIFRK